MSLVLLYICVYIISNSHPFVKVAKWAQTHHLDGVDFDLENFASGFRGGSLSDTQTVDWVANATNAARSVLGE